MRLGSRSVAAPAAQALHQQHHRHQGRAPRGQGGPLRQWPREPRDTVFLLAPVGWILLPQLPHPPPCFSSLLAVMLLCLGAANSLANPKQALRSVPAALYEASVAVVIALSVAPQLVESTQRVRRARRLRQDAFVRTPDETSFAPDEPEEGTFELV